METTRLKSEVAVTGADSGIGQPTVIAFANEGADVAITFPHSRAQARMVFEITSALP